MPNYRYKNQTFTEQQVVDTAASYGVSVQEYIERVG